MLLYYKATKRYFYVLLAPIIFGPIISTFLSPYIHNNTVHGFVETKFNQVLDSFRANFGEGLEREGAAVAVYYRGKRVVHLWGGYADKEAGRLWMSNTRTVLFSATKALPSLCIAVLVDRGYLSYNDKVVDYWPEYGRFGKENTTIEDVLTHKAGLPYLEDHIDLNDVIYFQGVQRKIEKSKPVWAPGSASGYHAVTFGFIIDGIVRRVDCKGRDVNTFFQEEIASPNGLHIDIGVSLHKAYQIARVTTPSLWEFLRDTIKNPKLLASWAIMYARFDGIINRIRSNPSWLIMNYDTVALNDPEILSLSIPSVTGVSNADDLAKLFALSLDGTIISNRTLHQLKTPTLNDWHLEKVTLWPISKGHGFFYEKNPLIPGTFTFGHPGYGGQFIHVDPENELVIAYVSNGLKTGTGELCGTYMRLLKKVYDVIGNK